MNARHLATHLILLLLIPNACASVKPAQDLETGRVRLVYIGDCWGHTPFLHMQDEPMFGCTPIPASTHEATYTDADLKRFMRLYMPRTYSEHVGQHDVVILSDPSLRIFTGAQLGWMEAGVREAGQGLLMAGGIQSFGGWDVHPSWGDTSVAAVLPVVCIEKGTVQHFFYAVPAPIDHPFLESLPWRTMPGFKGMNTGVPKEGSLTLLVSREDSGLPVLTYWEVGAGSGLAHLPDWTPSWGELIMDQWEYYPDYVVYLVYLVARLPVPQDLQMMHALRTAFHDYAGMKSMVLSLFDFVEKFGASADPLASELARISDLKREADRLYIGQEYDGCFDKFQEISDAFAKMDRDAIMLKDRALMWVFLLEWMVVTATLLVCGYVLWTLMIGRRLYQEVAVTRAS